MKILITTGIYPPDIGGSATYAKNLEDALKHLGHSVRVSSFGIEKRLPTGLRHLVFFLRILGPMRTSDITIALDSFSVAVPSVAAGRLLGKRVVVRIGGDVLWENWVERTREMVPLHLFYDKPRDLTSKERLMKRLTGWALHHASGVVFANDWVKDVFIKGYGLERAQMAVIENQFGTRQESHEPERRDFIAAGRSLFLKNGEILKRVFDRVHEQDSSLVLDTAVSSHEQLLERMAKCYAVIVPSLSDVSPNIVLEALTYGKPFICTRNTGIYERLKDVGIFVDPLNEQELMEAVRTLADHEKYAEYRKRALEYTFTHTYDEIAREFLEFDLSLRGKFFGGRS